MELFTIILEIVLVFGIASPSSGYPLQLLLQGQSEFIPFEGANLHEKQRSKKYSYSDENTEPEEKICSRGQFWHIRGLRCVPIACNGGNEYRDSKTGECIIGLLQKYTRYGVPKTIWRSNFNQSKNPIRYPLVRFRG